MRETSENILYLCLDGRYTTACICKNSLSGNAKYLLTCMLFSLLIHICGHIHTHMCVCVCVRTKREWSMSYKKIG